MRDGAKMDEDMEGKTHTERQTETETERIWSGLVQLSLDNNNNNNNERERETEREISNTRRRVELDRGPTTHPPWGRPPSWRRGSEKTQYLTLY